MPLGQLPSLKVDGVVYCQTAAIVEFASRKACLPKLTDTEALAANMVIETVREVMDAINKTAYSAMAATEGEYISSSPEPVVIVKMRRNCGHGKLKCPNFIQLGHNHFDDHHGLRRRRDIMYYERFTGS